MTLQEISQALGVLGVIVSVTYAAIQIRSNGRAVRASAYQHFVSSFTSHWDEMARNPELCGLLLRGTDDFESLDRLEKARLGFAITALMRRWENVWNHRMDGTLKDADVPTAHFQEAICSTRGFWGVWDSVKIQSGVEFSAYIDGLIARHRAAELNAPPQVKPAIPKWHIRPVTAGARNSSARKRNINRPKS
jgi:hypothetical protein